MDEDGFIRQRRNLIVISLILFFVQGTGITLTEINILGNKATLGRPLSLEPVLWLAWLYLVLRYWQAFREYTHPKFLQRYAESIVSHLVKSVRKHLRQAPLPEVPPADASISNRHSISLESVKVTGRLAAHAMLQQFFRISLPNGGHKDENRRSRWQLSRGLIVRARIAALLGLSLNSSLISELYLPFIVAVTPVVYHIAT